MSESICKPVKFTPNIGCILTLSLEKRLRQNMPVWAWCGLLLKTGQEVK